MLPLPRRNASQDRCHGILRDRSIYLWASIYKRESRRAWTQGGVEGTRAFFKKCSITEFISTSTCSPPLTCPPKTPTIFAAVHPPGELGTPGAGALRPGLGARGVFGCGGAATSGGRSPKRRRRRRRRRPFFSPVSSSSSFPLLAASFPPRRRLGLPPRLPGGAQGACQPARDIRFALGRRDLGGGGKRRGSGCCRQRRRWRRQQHPNRKTETSSSSSPSSNPRPRHPRRPPRRRLPLKGRPRRCPRRPPALRRGRRRRGFFRPAHLRAGVAAAARAARRPRRHRRHVEPSLLLDPDEKRVVPRARGRPGVQGDFREGREGAEAGGGGEMR